MPSATARPLHCAATRNGWRRPVGSCPRPAARPALDRLAELAARLLGTDHSQISLLTDVQVVAAGGGLPPGSVDATSPLEESLCTVTAAGSGVLVVTDARADARVRDLPPVTSGQVGAYLGTPLTAMSGRVIGALCVFGAAPRDWSDSDIATLRQLAESTVTELELSALVRQYESDRVRWGLAIDAAGIGTYDWDLVSGRLSWDRQLISMFGYDEDTFEQNIAAFTERLHPDDVIRVGDALQACIDTCGEFDSEYRVVRPDGETRWVHARGRALPDPTERRSGCSAPPTTRPASARPRRASPGCWRPCRPASTASTARGGSPTSTPRPNACSAARGRPCSAGSSGTTGRRRSTASSRTATARPSEPACPSRSTRTTRPPSTAGSSCAPGRAPTGCRSTSTRSPSVVGCRSRPNGPRAGWRSSPRWQPSWPAPWMPRPPSATSPRSSSRHWPTSPS